MLGSYTIAKDEGVYGLATMTGFVASGLTDHLH